MGPAKGPTDGEEAMIRKIDRYEPSRSIVNEAEQHLARMEPSLTKRRLERAVEMYWSTVDSRGTRIPTGEQLNLVRDHVTEVLKLARQAA
jgi:hypothetical protein